MNKISVIFLASFISVTAWGHGGEDPLAKLQKNRSRLTSEQLAFFQLENKKARIESLTSQLDYLQQNIRILRNLMAQDFPHVKEKMSKYKVDYIDLLDDSLKKLSLSVKQASHIIE